MFNNTELEKQLLEQEAPQEEVSEQWRIKTIGEADWAMEKVRAARIEIAQTKEYYEEKKRRIDAFVKSQTESLEKEAAFFEWKLREYATEYVKGKKTKTMKLAGGSCSFTKARPAFTKNEDELLMFVKENCAEYLNVKESVNWNEFKKTLNYASDGKMVTEDGEVVPGVTYTIGDDTFTVKTEV